MADADVAHLRQNVKLPEKVELHLDEGMPPHSPRETSMLRDLTGKGFQELVGEGADDGDREAVMVWFKLRRLGYEPTFEEARDVLIEYVAPDPTNAADSTPSPPSAGTGA
jgi:hypothetical protein